VISTAVLSGTNDSSRWSFTETKPRVRFDELIGLDHLAFACRDSGRGYFQAPRLLPDFGQNTRRTGSSSWHYR
jgi:hypothetical protein